MNFTYRLSFAHFDVYRNAQGNSIFFDDAFLSEPLSNRKLRKQAFVLNPREHCFFVASLSIQPPFVFDITARARQ